MKYINRDIEPVVKRAVRQFPSIIVTGPRQSGKTTLLKHLFSKTHNYISLDNPDIRLIAVKEPELFIENYPPPVIIDEIQYAPQLFSYLKIKIDENRSRKGLFILTGSQSFPLMAGVGESLAGRIAALTLLSFSINEQINKKKVTLDTLKGMILRGGFPELVVDKNRDLRLWFSSYLQTYLERDVRGLRQIGDLMDFQRFLELLASLNGQVLNLSGMSRDLGVAVNTVKAWISILEASSQIVLVKPFYNNRGKRITKSPKVYFLDSGFLCFLNSILYKEQVFKGPLSGQIFESIVLGELIRNAYNRGERPRIYWWRTSYGEEVDFVMEIKGKIIPLEIKLTSRINKQMAKSLISFCKLFSDKIEKAFLINLAQEKIALDKEIVSIPFIDFIYQLKNGL